ncbi:hypothetical protein FAI41_06900 [Acetobacteraceae bacterium]|nr:hypothetical protein FAI41_06900 [Acetobacteraceae bacterium]
MANEDKRAFVVPFPEFKAHPGCYACDHHVVRIRDKDANLLEEHEAIGDTAETAGDWALDQGYEVFIQKEELVRNGVKPDPKDPSQWRSYKEADRRLNKRKTLEEASKEA